MPEVEVRIIFKDWHEATATLPDLFKNGNGRPPQLTLDVQPDVVGASTGGGPKGKSSRKGKGSAAERDAMHYLQSFERKWVAGRRIAEALSKERPHREVHPPGTTRGALNRLVVQGYLEKRDSLKSTGHEYRRIRSMENV